METKFGNAVAGARRIMATRSWYRSSCNIHRIGQARLRYASASSKKPLYPKLSSMRTSTQRNPTQRGFDNTLLPAVIWPYDSQVITLPSGGMLSYAQLGRLAEVGQCWVLFHGTPGSRLDWKHVHLFAANHGIRVIAIDRPGYGYSSLHDRGMLGFIRDVEHLLDYRGVQVFKILSVGGGGPYALAAAYHFPKHRLKKTSIMCGISHPNFAAKKAISGLSGVAEQFKDWMPALRDPGGYFQRFRQRGIKSHVQYTHLVNKNYEEMQRQDFSGYNNDKSLAPRPWGFNLEDIDANPITWYHGAEDFDTPLGTASETALSANRYRHNIDFRSFPGFMHYTFNIHTGIQMETMEWLLK